MYRQQQPNHNKISIHQLPRGEKQKRRNGDQKTENTGHSVWISIVCQWASPIYHNTFHLFSLVIESFTRANKPRAFNPFSAEEFAL